MRRRLVLFSGLAIALLIAGGAAWIVLARGSDGEPSAETTVPSTTTQPKEPSPSVTQAPASLPNVVGLSMADAVATLTAVDLEVRVVKVSSGEASGVVIGQSPAAGTSAVEGDTVRIDVSRGGAVPEASARRRVVNLVPLFVGIEPDDPPTQGRCFGPYTPRASLEFAGIVQRTGFIQCGDFASGDPVRANGVYRFTGVTFPSGSSLLRVTADVGIDEGSSSSQRGSSVTWTVYYDRRPFCTETVTWSGTGPVPRRLDCRTSLSGPSGRFDLRRLQIEQLVSLTSLDDFWAGLLKPTIVVKVPSERAGRTARGVPSRYAGRFASVDRLQRCFANDDYAVCTSGPSGKSVRLVVGSRVRYEGVTGSTDTGGPAMPMGTSFLTPGGQIQCSSSYRGITCRDLTTGPYFIIGDHRLLVNNGSGEVVH